MDAAVDMIEVEAVVVDDFGAELGVKEMLGQG